MRHLPGLLLLAMLVFFAGAGPGWAHPHIFVDSTAQLVFDAKGRFTQIRHHWVFDKAFSAWVTQGLDVDGDGIIKPEEMQDLADENLLGLAGFEYYTFGGEGQTDLIFRPVGLAHMHVAEDGRVVLEFAVAPTKPYAIRQTLEIEVTDPDYYVSFTFPQSGGATLTGAPDACTVESHAPKPLSEEDANRLADIGMGQVVLPPELKALVRDQANIILVNCPSDPALLPEPQTALEAIDAVTTPVAAPFGGPPPEASLPMPKTGFLGWVNTQQIAFYKAVSNSLAAFRSDGSAFVVLGLLSFLYGIFHSAGPGHGKVVVSSYMLAGERKLKSGIILAFASALTQSLSAIVFVLIATAVLNMTSVAMSGVTASIELISYTLILVLGLWLLVRKITGLGGGGHHHSHDHHDAHDHHVVVPKKGQSLKETIGLVLAVGLRPCSGALVVLVFALSQGVLLAGIGAVLLMGVGTAITVSTLAILAVGAKALALKIGSRTESAHHVVTVMELIGALMLIVFGAVMLLANLFG